MMLSIEVDNNVAEKLKLLSKLGGQNAEDLNSVLSKSVDDALSRQLVTTTKHILASVGVSSDMLMGYSIEPQPGNDDRFSMTTKLGDSVEDFDKINAASAGNLLEDEPVGDTPTLNEEDKELDTSSFEDEDEDDGIASVYTSGMEDDDSGEADPNSWQASIQAELDGVVGDVIDEDFDEDFDDPVQTASNSAVKVASYDSSLADEFGGPTIDVLPSDLGINSVSVKDGDFKGSVDFMTTLLKGNSAELLKREYGLGGF